MTNYQNYSISLSDGQKIALAKAIKTKQPITIRLSNSQLIGNDEMLLTKTQINKIKNSISKKSGMDLKISKTQVTKTVKHGGALFSTLFNLGARLLPKIIPTVSKVGSKILPGLSSGVLSSLGNFGMDKILGKGVQNRPQPGGFYQVPFQNLPQLSNALNLLTKAQQKEYMKAIKSRDNLIIKPTVKQKQHGGFLGLLASIAAPLIIDALLKGKGLRNRVPKQPAPFIGTWKDYNTIGSGQKKTKKKKKQASGLILGKNSPFKNIPLLGAIL